MKPDHSQAKPNGKPLKQKRKTPKQDRAKETVDAILTATAQVLEGAGYARLTTKAIAKRAGVSPGTFYQYFDGKAAAVGALSLRRKARLRDAILADLAASPAATLREQLRRIASLILRQRWQEAELDRKLEAALLELDGPCIEAENDAFYQMARSVMVAHKVPGDHDMKARLIVRTLLGILLGGPIPQWEERQVADATATMVEALIQREGAPLNT